MAIPKLSALDRKDTLIFFIGLFSMIKVRFLGTFGISEILVFCSYFFIGLRLGLSENKRMNHIVLLALLWLIGIFIADRFNDINLIDSLKGSFNVIFIILLIPFVYWILKDKPERVILFWIGNGISSLFAFYFQRVDLYNEFDADVWRVYAFYPAFIALSGWLYYRGRVFLSCIVIEAFALWSLFHMSRNIFLSMTCAVSLIIFIEWIKRSSFDRIKKYRQRLVYLIAMFGVVLVGIYYTYEYLASNKYLGEAAYNKYVLQKYSDKGLASGRSDAFQSLYLIYKNPIFGYGSYARDKNELVRQFDSKTNRDRHDLLPGHSYILGAWVYAGIGGAVFWFYVLYLIFLFIRGGILLNTKLIGINVLLTFQTIWNILFSPFSDRLNILFYIILVIIQMNLSKEYGAGKETD